MISSGGNTRTISYFGVTIFTPSITSIACCIAALCYRITNFCIYVILIIEFAVSSSTSGAVCLNLTSSSTTAMVDLIKLSTARASVEMLCSVAFPLTICINMVASCRNSLTVSNLGITILTPSITSVTCIFTVTSYSITNLGIFVFASCTLNSNLTSNSIKIKIVKIEIVDVTVIISNPNIVISCSSRRINSEYQSG